MAGPQGLRNDVESWLAVNESVAQGLHASIVAKSCQTTFHRFEYSALTGWKADDVLVASSTAQYFGSSTSPINKGPVAREQARINSGNH